MSDRKDIYGLVFIILLALFRYIQKFQLIFFTKHKLKAKPNFNRSLCIFWKTNATRDCSLGLIHLELEPNIAGIMCQCLLGNCCPARMSQMKLDDAAPATDVVIKLNCFKLA